MDNIQEKKDLGDINRKLAGSESYKSWLLALRLSAPKNFEIQNGEMERKRMDEQSGRKVYIYVMSFHFIS